MAMVSNAPVNSEPLTDRFGHLTTRDDFETVITVCTWNIMGTASAANRKKVTTATFLNQYCNPFRANGTSLGQSDIICIQEMKFNPQNVQRVTATEYLPFMKGPFLYGVVQSQEPGSNTHNGVFYNKDKFSEANVECLQKAYTLMEYKRECYDSIKRRGDVEIDKAVKGISKLTDPEWGDSVNKRAMCQEVFQECKAAGSPQGFYEIFDRYCAPRERETRSPKELLERRMAVCVLKAKFMRDYYIVVLSVHNYNTNTAKSAPINFAMLLFDFLSKLPRLSYTVILAGDFNFDITDKCQASSLEWHLGGYIIPDYAMKPLRNRLNKIDFIVVRKTCDDKVDVQVDVQAHDLQIPVDVWQNVGGEIKKITNHNPLSATIKVKKKVSTAWPVSEPYYSTCEDIDGCKVA